MYILKNAIKNIARSMGRNILIGIIALVIAISSCVALSIKQAAKTAESDGLKNLSITASIGVDMKKLQQESNGDRQAFSDLRQKYPAISLDEMQKYAKSSYVKEFNYSLRSSVSKTDGIEPYTETSTSTSSTNSTSTANQNINQQKTDNIRGRGFGGMGQQGDFTLIGYSSENAMTDFVNSTNKITTGTVFSFDTADYSCLISDTLATFNGLKVGDKIKLANPNLDTETYDFTIVGTYSTTTANADTMKFSASQDLNNYIYMNYNTIKDMTDKSTVNAQTGTDDSGNPTTTALRNQTNSVYSFSDVDAFNNFKNDVVTLGLSPYYTVTSSDVTNYDQSLIPIKNLSKFANIFLVLVLLIGGIILVVLNIFNVRERKYEVGVLTAIGMKKTKVALQFITELFLVTFMALVIGTSIGAVASVPVANTLLKSQITSAQSQQNTQNQNFGKQGMGQVGNFQFRNLTLSNNNVSYIENITASTDVNVVMQLVGIGILLTVLSSCGAVIFILRYEPLKILSNRN